MSKTAITTTISQSPVPPGDAVPPARRPRPQEFLSWGLKNLASLRLTVALFSLSLVLVFCGTLAQRDAGIWTVVGQYFRSAYVWIPLRIFLPSDVKIGGGFPFPGGWLIGGLLLVNLLAAHATRFKVSWKRLGILLIHAGLIVLMMSELVTGMFAVEGNMTIEQGKASNYLEHNRFSELAFVDSSDPNTDDVVVIPDTILQKKGLIENEQLPCDVEVVRYMVNSNVVRSEKAGPKLDNPATTGAGLDSVAVEQAEVSGTDQKQTVDLPSAYVTFKKKGNGENLGTYLVSILLKPQPLTLDGKTYEVSLRFKRTYKPYTLHLREFHHDKYIGTDTPRNFSSLVRLEDPTRNEDREVLIYMNHPLAHAGETFYQSAVLGNDEGTILQVVKNPGWTLPYVSCVMVALGMLYHFGIHLVEFLRRRVVA